MGCLRPQGESRGSNSIQLILKDCVIFENWKDGFGGEGKSFNKYNPDLKQWEQFWVDERRGRLFFTGRLEDGEMRFHATRLRPRERRSSAG